MLEIAGIGAVRCPGKSIISADQHSHPALLKLRENFLRMLELVHYAGILCLLVSDAPGFGFVHQVVQQPDRRRHEDPVASGLHEVQAFLVGVFAVIQDVHTMLERQLDRCRRTHVSGYPFAVCMRGFDRRRQLVLAHDGDVRARARNGLIA